MCHWSSRVQNCGHNKSEGAGTSRILKQISWCCHPARLPERLFQLPLLKSTCPLPVAMPLLPFVTCSWTQWSKPNKPGLICTQLSGWCYKRWFTACRNSTRRAKKVVGENIGLALSACPEGNGQKRVALGWCEHQCAEFSAVLCWTWQEANLSVPAGFATLPVGSAAGSIQDQKDAGQSFSSHCPQPCAELWCRTPSSTWQLI